MDNVIKKALEQEALKREEQLNTVNHSISVAKQNIKELEKEPSADPKYHEALDCWHRVIAVGEKVRKSLIR